MKTSITMFCASLFLSISLNAQVYYVDSKNGNNINLGNKDMPFKSIEKAVKVANNLTGKGAITIKMMPGLYVLHDKVDINPVRVLDKNSQFKIEAEIMPDDSTWTPYKMPVIMSVSENNSETQFKHSTGFLVSSNYVEFRGIKFLGNPNSSVKYYYPITRQNPSLDQLVVSQCMFISDKNSGNIQGGVWAHGANIDINHNLFYQCRNAILLFKKIDYSIISNNIIYDAYESALWIGDDKNLKFENNIVSNCNYFWVGNPNSEINYVVSNSIISECKYFRGDWGDKGGITESKKKFKEININKVGEILLKERDNSKIPYSHLHLIPESVGNDLNAGIFK
jgi:hypothetical protein